MAMLPIASKVRVVPVPVTEELMGALTVMLPVCAPMIDVLVLTTTDVPAASAF